MKGDEIALPFQGTVRIHRWEPQAYKSAPEQPPRSQGKFTVRPPSAGTMRAKILALLRLHPDGLTNIEIRSVLHIGKGPTGSMLCQMCDTGEIVRDGTRKCGVKSSTVYKVKS